MKNPPDYGNVTGSLKQDRDMGPGCGGYKGLGLGVFYFKSSDNRETCPVI